MRQYVLDANILFSGVISQKPIYRAMFGEHLFYIISESAYTSAEVLVADIDPKDVAYVALNEELGATLLTRDKVLHDGLRAKGYERVKLFNDFIAEQLAGGDVL